jgi:hypothetical protein
VQLLLDWDKRDRDLASLRRHASTAGLLPADVDLLVSVATTDAQRSAMSCVCKSKQQWALAMGVGSRNTPIAAMRRLAQRKLLAWEVTPAGHVVLVDWQAVWALPPAEPATQSERLEAALKAEKDELVRPVVRPGQTAPRVLVEESKARVSVSRESVSSATRGIERRLVRPWARQGGLTGDDLVWAVRDRSRVVLRRLYYAAVETGWWADCEDHRTKFLILAHHCATTAENPMALLTAMCRQDAEGTVLRSQRCTDASRDWVDATRAQWRRASDDVLETAEARRQAQPRRVLVGSEEVG